MTLLPALRPGTRHPLGSQLAFALPALVGAVALGAAISRAPVVALMGTAAIALGTLIFFRPAVAAYVLIGVTPLVVGIDRGRIVPLLRPNEALLLLCAAALTARWLWNLRTGARLRPRLGIVAASLVLMAVFNSVVPLLWMSLRGSPISADDISYAIVLWKYLAVYAVVRASIRGEPEVRRCLWIAMAAASVVAIIAVLQSLQLFGVAGILDTWYAPFGDTSIVSAGRGSSTLGLAAATADLMIFNLALAAGFWRRHGFRPVVLAPMAALFLLGTLASGQFSSALGLVIAILLIGLVFRRADIPIAMCAVGVAAAGLLQPVIANRLSGFDGVSGLPESWLGRLYNLSNYFWPKLFSDNNFVLGVGPSARVPSPRTLALPWVWIESGYTWLLWGGGIPLFLSFALFVVASCSRSWRLTGRRDAAGITAISVFVAVPVIAVLMLFDPHITYRGSGDLLFALLALMAVRGVEDGNRGMDVVSQATDTSSARSRARPVTEGSSATMIEVDER